MDIFYYKFRMLSSLEINLINIYQDCIQYYNHTMRPYLSSVICFQSQEFIYLDHVLKSRSDPEDSRGQRIRLIRYDNAVDTQAPFTYT